MIASGVRLPVLALMTLFLGTCSSNAGPRDAATVETAPTMSDAAGGELSRGSCDLVAQDCPAAMKCDFYCDGAAAVIGCRADNGGGALGQPCSGPNPCAKGSGCFAMATTTVACRKYCATNADCPAGICRVVNVGVACGADGGASTLVIRVCF